MISPNEALDLKPLRDSPLSPFADEIVRLMAGNETLHNDATNAWAEVDALKAELATARETLAEEVVALFSRAELRSPQGALLHLDFDGFAKEVRALAGSRPGLVSLTTAQEAILVGRVATARSLACEEAARYVCGEEPCREAMCHGNGIRALAPLDPSLVDRSTRPLLFARGGEDVRTIENVGEARACVLDIVINHGPISAGNIARKMMGVGLLPTKPESYSLATVTLVALATDGLVNKSGNGRSTHWRATPKASVYGRP